MPQMPDIDPTIYNTLQDGQMDGEPQVGMQPQEPQVGMQPQEPQMQQPMPGQPMPGDEGDVVDEAKRALGLDELEKKIQEQEKLLAQIEAEKAKALMESKYPNVPYEVVQKEIERVEKVNPALAEAMRTNADAMELAYKAALASIKPQEQPDKITEGEGGGDDATSIEEAIKKGEADDFMLGEWILKGS